MIKIDENDPIGEVDPSFPYRDVVIRKNTDMKEFYDLQKEIGRGKFGTVYRCTEKATGLKLAAKFIGISKRQDRRNAEREVEIMRELQHPRLIQMYDAFEINNIMCVVLELIEGGELFERVIDDDFILTEKSVSVFMRQICEGIAFIHSKNILHLDMKPENILCLSKTGNRIKIIDFGLARKYDAEKKLQVLFGTPEFVAPEVVNFDSIGFGTDMWSVGVICYVLLSGLSPFMGETDVQTMANVTIAQYDFDDEAFNDISTDAKDFIGKLLLKDREQRMSATECLSHSWLQRRKPPVVSSTTSPNPTISQSELDLQKDTLRYLVDRWNNDTNITLVLNKDDDKCDKVVDICKTNGIIEQQSKSMVCESSHLPANDTTIHESAIQHPPHEIDITDKSTNLETTLVPIQSIEAPSVSNQVLKSLTDVVSTDRPAQNLKRSLSPDTIKTETSKKEQSAKIPKSLTPSRSGSISPGIRKTPIFDGAESIKDEPSPKLPKPSKLETPTESSKKELSEVKKLKLKIPTELSQNEFSEVEKSPSVSPKPMKKKTLTKSPPPSITDHPIDHKNELKTSQEEMKTNELNQKLPKSPSSLEIPKTLHHQKEFTEIQKSPSTSPKPLKRSPSKTPSPSIKDQPNKFIPIKDEMMSSQEIPQPSMLNLPENSTHTESSTIKKSPSTSPKPLKKNPTKSPSPSIKDQPNEFMPITVEIKSSQEILKPSILNLPENSTHTDQSSTIKKSPSTSPKPLKKEATKSPSPSIKDQPDELVPITIEIKSSEEIPNPSILNLPENSTHIESSTIKESPSTSPKPLKKKRIKSSSPSIKNQPNEFIVPIEIESRQEIPKSSILNLPENSTHTESLTVKKSPSASPKSSKKVPTKPPSPSIQDQLFVKENIATRISPPVTPEKSPQRDTSDGKKLSKTVPQSVASSATIQNKYQSKVFEKLAAPTSDAKICDIVKQNTIVDKSSQLVNSKDNVHSTVSNFNLAQHDDKLENEFNTLPTTDSHSTQTAGVELAQVTSKEITKRSNDKLHDIPTTHSINQSQSIRTPTVEISDETYEYVKKRRFTIKSVEPTKTADNENSTIHTKSTEKNTIETSPQFPHRRSIFSPEVSPKVLRKLNDFVSTSELMKRRISDISNLLTRTGQDMEQSLPDDMSSFCSKLNRIVRLRHDSYSIDGSSNPNYKRPKFRMSFLSRDVPFSSTSPVNADLLNYLPLGEETSTTSLWSFQKTNPFHSDPSSLRNSPERFSSPSFTKKLLSKFFNDSLEYDISSTPSTSTNGLPKDKITEIIS